MIRPRLTTPGRAPVLLSVLALAALPALAACGSGDDSSSTSTSGSATSTSTSSDATTGSGTAITKDAANAKVTLTVGSKNFTEQKILGEIYAQSLSAAGYKVKKALNLGDENTALKSLETNQISAYPEYIGTALTALFSVKTQDVPAGTQAAFADLQKKLATKNLVGLPPTPFTDANEVAVTQATAKKYNLKKISDLAKVAPQLTLAGSPECRQRLDCLLGLQQRYGLKFKKYTATDLAQRSTVLTRGQAQVSIVFTTDAANKRDKLVLLEDDKGIFPPYNVSFIVRKSDANKAGPDLAATIANVNKQLTVANVQELNARVDLDKETPKDAAAQYLKSFGYVK